MLVPSDEGFNHQIVETFATVSHSDPAWTEKVWGSIFRNDGYLGIGWGMGKYINRNVMDGYAGVSRGVEQWTVRGSRMLFPTPDSTSVGPIHYEILEPLKKLRIRLEENDEQPIAFDVTLNCDLIPPFMENHEHRRQIFGFRVENDLCRYHQVGTAEGWLLLDGVRHEINPKEWSTSRDHSWGVRYEVGQKPTDMMPGIDSSQLPMHLVWCPMLFTRDDGSHYSIHHFFLDMNLPDYEHLFHGGIEYPDGTRTPFVDLKPALEYDPTNLRLKGGQLHFTEQDGGIRTLDIEVVSDTGFNLGAGLYFGYKGFNHGCWRGKLHVEGDYVANCADPATARELHQLRDCIIKVNDNGTIGYAICQTIINGAWPDYNLGEEDSFL
jgi:hypothetical protein